MECKALRDSDQEIQDYNLAYFMASTDSIIDNTAFAMKNEATFPILSDEKKSMTRAFGVLSDGGYARRWTFYIDIDGIIRKIDRSVRPSSAGKDLVINLKDMAFLTR